MKIAILLSGQPRFTEDFNLFLSNLKGYTEADWFVYISNNFNSNNTKSVIEVADIWKTFDPSWAYERIKSMLPHNNTIRSFEISDADNQIFPPVVAIHETDIPANAFKMFYNMYMSDQARQQYEQDHNFKYDLVIRTRADLGLYNELNLDNLDFSNNVIIMPTNDWHGNPRANDQFAIGKSDSMSIYGTVYTRLKEYNNRGAMFHPESMVGYNLRVHNIPTKDGNFIAGIRRYPLIKD